MSARLRWSRAVDAAVWTVAASGCALSYDSIQSAAEAHVDFEPLSYLLPLATDGAAIAAAARYVLDRRQGLSGRGWQGLAWSAIGASIALNVVGRDLVDALWHVAGPAVLAAVTELYAHRAARQFVAERHQAHELGAGVGIPRRLWVTAPVSSWRLWLWMARTGTRDSVAARIALGRYAAAREALRAACAGRAYRRMRRVAARQLRAATLAPASVLDVLGWSGGRVPPADAPAALRALLATALAGGPAPTTVEAVVSTGTRPVDPTASVEVDGGTGRVLDPSPDRVPGRVEGPGRLGRVEMTHGSRPTGMTHGSSPFAPARGGRSGRGETSCGSRPAASTAPVRGRDEAQVRAELVAALREGRLTASSSVEEVRRVLGMAWRTARPWQARLAELAAEATQSAVEVDPGVTTQVEAPAGGDVASVEAEVHNPVEAGEETSGRSIEPCEVDLDRAAVLDPAAVAAAVEVDLALPVEPVSVEVDRSVLGAVA